MKTEGWAIKGTHGFYVGWWQTREEAMRNHCRDLAESWSFCRKKGDRAVRVCITELPAKRKSMVVAKTVRPKRAVQHTQPKICQHHRYGTRCVFNREWNGIKIMCSHKPCAVKLPAGA